MIDLKFRVQTAFRKLAAQITHLAQSMNREAKSRSPRWAGRAVAKLRTEPGPPRYPIRWASAKQRRAFFASKGFGRGIPTRRTNTIISGWSAELETDNVGGRLFLANPHEAMPYLQYNRVQPFHLDTGYVQVDEVADEFFQDTSEGVRLTWYDVAQEAVRTSAIRRARR